MMKQKQWRFQNNSSAHVKKLTDNFAVINAPFQPLANPPSCITAIYAKNKVGIEKDAHYRSETAIVQPSPHQ